jgi:hypothetical protein
MRTIVAGLLLTLALSMTSALPVRACTGCSDPFSSVVKPAKAIALVTVDRAPEGSIDRVRVDAVYKGALPSRIAYEPDKPSLDLARGSRWILVINRCGVRVLRRPSRAPRLKPTREGEAHDHAHC